MHITQDILKALAVFHLDNPELTWDELKDRLDDIGREALSMAHGDDSLHAYAMVYGELAALIPRASAYAPLSLTQQRAVPHAKAIMDGAHERVQGDPQALLKALDDLNGSVSVPLSVQVKVSPKEPLTWDKLAALYMAEHKDNIKESTRQAMLTNYNVISESLATTGLVDLRGHTRSDMVALRAELHETRKASTVNNLLTKLVTVMTWAVDNDHLPKAYTSKLKFTKGADSAREAFTREQANTVMAHAVTLPKDSWERWGVSLLTITGARVGEVAQLTASDIKQIDGFWCIHINEDSPDKSIKNKHSARVVPLVDGALGFDLKAFLQAVEEGHLPSHHGVNARKASVGLGAVVREALGESCTENQTLHSLRHHLASSMKSTGVGGLKDQVQHLM